MENLDTYGSKISSNCSIPNSDDALETFNVNYDTGYEGSCPMQSCHTKEIVNLKTPLDAEKDHDVKELLDCKDLLESSMRGSRNMIDYFEQLVESHADEVSLLEGNLLMEAKKRSDLEKKYQLSQQHLNCFINSRLKQIRPEIEVKCSTETESSLDSYGLLTNRNRGSLSSGPFTWSNSSTQVEQNENLCRITVNAESASETSAHSDGTEDHEGNTLKIDRSKWISAVSGETFHHAGGCSSNFKTDTSVESERFCNCHYHHFCIDVKNIMAIIMTLLCIWYVASNVPFDSFFYSLVVCKNAGEKPF